LQALKNEQNYANANLETTGGPLVVRNEKLVNLAKQISQMRSDLAAAQRVYGDNYPDIQSRKAAVEQLEQEQAELEKQDLVQQSSSTQQPQRAANPQMAKTLRDLEADQKSTQAMILVKETEIEELTKQKGEVERQIVAYRKRIEEAPLSEQQYATLLTQQSLYKQQYEDLERRHSTAETAQNLDERKAGENLEVLDMANLPDKPVSPNRLEWAGTGSLVGLVCGLVLAAAKEVKNTSLKNLKDVRAYTNLPVLTSIPLLENALLLRRKRRLVYLAWSTAFLVGCAMMGGSMYYYMTST